MSPAIQRTKTASTAEFLARGGLTRVRELYGAIKKNTETDDEEPSERNERAILEGRDARPIGIAGDEKASLREMPVELSVEGFWTNIAWWRIGAVAMCCCLFAERFPRGVAAQLPESPADCP